MVENYFDLLGEFVRADFKHRYKSSILGFAWMIIKPLAHFSVLYFVWSAVFKQAGQTSLFLFSGIIFNNYINDGIRLGLDSLLNKAGIILKINFPREVVLFSASMTAFINFLITFLVLLVFIFVSQTPLSPAGLTLFALAVLTTQLFVITWSFFLSIWNILVRDIHHLVELILQMVFWATPVLYNIEQLSPKSQKIIRLNPLTHILTAFRKGLLDSLNVNLSDFTGLLLIVGMILPFTIVGYFYFKKYVKKVAEYV